MLDLTNAEVTWLDLPIGHVRCRQAGQGEPILFVHGLLVDSRLWEGVAARLASNYRVILPDLPLGSHTVPVRDRSMLNPDGLAQTLVDVLDALGLERVTVVGNDTGGALTQIAVAAHPQRFARLVLTSCDAFDNFPPPLIAPFKPLTYVPGGLWLCSVLLGNPIFQNPLLPLGWVAKRPLDPELARSLAEPTRTNPEIRRDVALFIRTMHKGHTHAAAKKLANYPGPSLIAWSREDRLFPRKDAERLAALLPKSQLVWIDDAYCFSSLDQPDAVAAEIREFLVANV